MAYWLIVEGRTPEGRAEVDRLLSGEQDATAKKERIRTIAGLGGEMKGGGR